MIRVETEISSKDIVAGLLADPDNFANVMEELSRQAKPEFFKKMGVFAATYEADCINEFFGKLKEALTE